MQFQGHAEISQPTAPIGDAPSAASFLAQDRDSVFGRLTDSLLSKRYWFVRAFFVVVLVILSTLLRVWMDRAFGLHFRYLTYFPAVFLAASLFGVAEGIYATIASLLLAIDPLAPGALTSLTTANKVSIVFLAVSGVVLSIVAGALRSRTVRMHQALNDLRVSEERVFAEKHHLFEANLRMATIVESSEEAIIGEDPNGIVTSWNRGAGAIFGYTAQEMIGRPIQTLLPQGREAEVDEILSRILKGEQVIVGDALRVAKDGHSVHVSLHISPIRDRQGSIIGVCKVAHDITETLKLQRQLQQSQKMEAIGQLAGGIAHDFNNLLAILLGALELQQTAIADNPEALKRWEVAHRAAKRGAELTRRLLAFSSMEHFKIATTDLNQSVRGTMEMATRLLGPENRVELNLQPGLDAVLVDPAGLESALLNLIVNSRDAMAANGGGLITIGTRTAELDEGFAATLTGTIAPGFYGCISITDNGCGMSSEVLDRACEPFFTTKERGRGTGLGLSMVYGFVKHSGGGIRIYSEPGYGTTITIYLPFDSSAAVDAKPVKTQAAMGKRSGTLLIVDDETDLLELSATYLKAQGYSVSTAENAEAALRVLSESPHIDVMVTDIVMGGGMDGVELAREVRRASPTTRVIYSSGFPADALSERNLSLADAFMLQKPYRLVELSECLDRAFDLQATSAPVSSHSSHP